MNLVEKNNYIFLTFFLILIYFLIKQNTEHMTDDSIKNKINTYLNVEIDQIRNLGIIIKNLLEGNVTSTNDTFLDLNIKINGELTVKGTSFLKDENLNFDKKWSIHTPKNETGTLSINQRKPDGTINKTDLSLYTNNIGNQNKGGLFTFLPKGSIMPFAGTTIPDTWALCDGQNGTPDLRGKFVLGMGAGKNLNTTGGAEIHTLSVAELPAHDHTYSGKKIDHNIVCPGPFKDYVHYPLTFYPDNPLTGTSTAAGGGGAHNNMPPYYVLTYIMKIV